MTECYLKTPESIHTKKEKTNDFFFFQGALEKDYNYFISQYETGRITKEDLAKLANKIKNLLNNYNYKKEEAQKKYNEWKQELLKKTGLQLSETLWITQNQIAVYDMHGIDKHTYNNSPRDMFTKGMIDAFYIDNLELLEIAKEKGIYVIDDILKQLLTWEGVKEIAKSTGENVCNIFSGDSYERGKSVIELGLIGFGVKLLEKGAKIGVKKGLKEIVKKTGEVSTKVVDNLIVTPEIIGDIIKNLEIRKILDKIETKILLKKIVQNNPCLGIFEHLKKGDNFQSIIFNGLKGVNDLFSQNFTDTIIDKFKNTLIENYPGLIPVWDDYKNFSLKISDTTTKIPSPEELNNLLKNIYNEELAKLTTRELEKIKQILKTKGKEMPEPSVSTKTGKISGNSQEKIMLSLAEIRTDLEKKALGEIVLDVPKLMDKLKEVTAKYSIKSNHTEIFIDKRGRTKYTIKNGVIEKEFTVKQSGRVVKSRTLILDSTGNINPKIINMVRKNEIPSDLKLFKDIEIVIKSAIANGEFIGPYRIDKLLNNGDLIDPKLLESYKKIKEKLKKGEKLNQTELDKLKEFTTYSYKNALDKGTFYSKLKKTGGLYFIDIAGMGNINIADFLSKIKTFHKQLEKLENMYKSRKISQEAYEKAIKGLRKKLLLHSGSYMTKKFQKILPYLEKEIGNLYPGKKVHFYIGGDEIGIFVEGIGKLDDKVNSIINKCLDENLIEGRTTKKLIGQNDITLPGKKIFEQVDKLSKYSKIIERRINEAIEQVKTGGIMHSGVDILIKLKKLKNFDVSVMNGEKFITFHSLVIEGKKKFKLEKIINTVASKNNRNLKLKHDSPLIRYLRENYIDRENYIYPMAA